MNNNNKIYKHLQLNWKKKKNQILMMMIMMINNFSNHKA